MSATEASLKHKRQHSVRHRGSSDQFLIATPSCPQCNLPARATLETLTGQALLEMGPAGKARYTGYTAICWDSQRSVRDVEGRVTLECHQGHQWQSHVGGAK